MKRSDATAALSWANNTRATADTRITDTEFRVLCVIAGGCQTRAQISAAAGCSESTVPRAVRKLEKIGALKRTPEPGKANSYVVLVRADTGTIADTRTSKARESSATGAKPDTGRSVDNGDAHIEHAGARAQLTLNNTTSELNSERDESSFESGTHALAMPEFAGELDLEWSLSDKHRKFANERGYLNGSCDELFGQFLDHCATKGPQISVRWGSEWRKWVRRETKFDTKPNNGNSHDQQRTGAADEQPRVRREAVSPTTAARMRRREEREARNRSIDYGRVESVRVE